MKRFLKTVLKLSLLLGEIVGLHMIVWLIQWFQLNTFGSALGTGWLIRWWTFVTSKAGKGLGIGWAAYLYNEGIGPAHKNPTFHLAGSYWPLVALFWAGLAAAALIAIWTFVKVVEAAFGTSDPQHGGDEHHHQPHLPSRGIAGFTDYPDTWRSSQANVVYPILEAMLMSQVPGGAVRAQAQAQPVARATPAPAAPVDQAAAPIEATVHQVARVETRRIRVLTWWDVSRSAGKVILWIVAVSLALGIFGTPIVMGFYNDLWVVPHSQAHLENCGTASDQVIVRDAGFAKRCAGWWRDSKKFSSLAIQSMTLEPILAATCNAYAGNPNPDAQDAARTIWEDGIDCPDSVAQDARAHGFSQKPLPHATETSWRLGIFIDLVRLAGLWLVGAMLLWACRKVATITGGHVIRPLNLWGWLGFFILLFVVYLMTAHFVF